MTDVNDAERRAWAYLAAVAEPPSASVIALVSAIGAVAAAAAVRDRKAPVGHLAALAATEARHATDTSVADLDTADRVGARLVTPDDEEWPGWSLSVLDRASTAARGGGPLALWVRGPGALSSLGDPAVALVGSRAASSYGEYVAGQFASGLAAHGRAVVSGGAYGIDGAAHRGSLAAGGLTVAVLACGVDRDYPTGHARLLHEIAARGLVVSEYAPGTTAAKHRFLTRNRLVAALSGATVVVEAGRRSGAANTAAWATRLGRPLGAVPGAVTSATSVGTHAMIADGQATLVADVDQVASLVVPDGEDTRGPAPIRDTDGLPPDQFRVIEALPARESLSIDEISFSAGIPVDAVRRALAALDVAGLVDEESGLWCLRR
ncbi:DNA-processing protein DprA [Gordonia liuliyuniae]|uniref:DNA-processing protein DprA n=1 Tax=Gordonia liuliyuniae TaxID=2911517 RepID=A0ABS9IRP7_9ACTN|nr:DNA-processing protein DprA [Gordonia liuliyuniae]MCF8588230.1 DNA-processing protein DprA [Gordonia liuliyuniae]